MNAFKRAYLILCSIFLTIFLSTNIATAQDQVFTSAEEMPRLHGDLDSLQNEIEYPRETIEAGIEGRVTVQFVVNKEGKAQDIEVVRGIGGGLDREAVRLIEEAQFTAGKQRGVPVNVRQTLRIPFEIPEQTDKSSSKPSDSEETEDDFFVAVENMPELKGGLGELQKKLEYPEIARRKGTEGRVTVQFIVNKQGNVENPTVKRGLCDKCDEEAIRLLKEEAEFEPGRQNGEPVRVQYSLPITFQISNDK